MLKALTTHLTLVSLIFSMTLAPMNLVWGQGFDPFAASNEVEYQADDISDLNDEELAFIMMARQMERKNELCKQAGGEKGYKLGEIEDPDSQTNPKEKINCNEVAQFIYDMSQGEFGSEDRTFKCMTEDWDYDTKLDFFNDLDDVAISAEKHFNCPGKDMIADIPSALKVVMLPAKLAGDHYCKGFKSSTDNGCMSNLLWGVWKSLIGNVEGLWSLAGMAWEGAKSAGKAVADFLCFWCDDEAQAAENANEMQLHAINQQSDGWFSKFVDSPIGAMTDMFSNFWSGMKKFIAESVQSNFMCLNWNGQRNLGSMAGDIKKAFI